MLRAAFLTNEKSRSLLVLAFLMLITFGLYVGPVVQLPLRIPLNYNEGWNAFHAVNAMNGRPLYPDRTSLTTNDYPPLSFYVVGSLGVLIGDQIFAGRLVALLSLLIVATEIGLVIYRFGQSSQIALFSGVLLLGYMATHFDSYIAMDDPQMLAHAIQLAGLLVFLAGNRTDQRLLLSLLLLFASGLVKHNLLPLPFALTVWLYLYERRHFYIWLLASIVLVVLAGSVCYLLFGSNIFLSILTAPQVYIAARMAQNADRWLTPMLILIAAGIILLVSDYANRYVRLFALYALFAGAWGIFVSRAVGVNFNAIFDLLFALIIMSGLALHRVEQMVHNAHPIDEQIDGPPGKQLALRSAGMLVLALTVLAPTPAQGLAVWDSVRGLDHAKTETAADIAYLAQHPGPALCENLALCYWAGKSFEVDVFNTGKKLQTGVLDKKPFVDRLRNHYFAVIELRSGTDRVPKDILSEVTANYEITRYGSRLTRSVFLLPKAP